jgi:RimJ/RimL family protein N-acetyltransferase
MKLWTRRSARRVAPRIVTPRLVLRAWEDRDREPWRAMCADPEVMRYIADGSPLGAAESDESIERFRRCWREDGFSFWALELRDSGRFIGFCGMQPVPDGSGRIEIGWRLERAAWGRGYATEAALPARDFAFAQCGLDRLVALFQPPNVASLRVMEKLGMTYDSDEVNAQGIPTRVYALERADWERLTARA